ncbi:hypothetical protein [Nocardioides sp. Leaf285]|uniref:hypothetical protein n=1 Tax=Nocardioides sp. Leaf285 TaxID=1736322 RepID=UPI000702A7CE|nr:hypothetical protein [Nocardioides sp. Leaf285]KQP63772.1 hypothetical protein ASF47_17500 [Nocardioides sp. Leaf285]
MRFRIEAAPSAGLRVIPEIPDGQLVQIDGRNGIGKTLAIRLLQLATTSQPFADKPQSWTTLKENLNPVTIWADGLASGKTLRFSLDPGEWPDEPKPPSDWLGSVYLDDDPIAWSAVPALLQVRRIGGDETLGESLAGQVATDRERLRQVSVRQKPRRDDWNGRIGALRLLTEVPAAFDFLRLRTAIERAESDLETATNRLTAAENRAEHVAEIARIFNRHNAVVVERPRLIKRIADLTTSIDELRVAASELDERAAEVLRHSQQTDEVWAKVEHLTSLQRKRRDRRERRRRELADLSRAADVSVPVDLAAAQGQIDALSVERERLEEQRQTVDRAGLVLELLDAIEGPIDRGLAARLADEIVAQLPAGPISLGELDRGVAARRPVLDKIERSAGTEILEAIEEIDRQIEACEGLPAAVRLLASAEEDLQETEQQLGEFLRTLTGGVADDYETLNEERVQQLDKLTLLVEERTQAEAELTELTSEGDEEVLARLTQEQTTSLGAEISPADTEAWADLVTGIRRDVAAATSHLTDATGKRDAARTELVQAESAVRGATTELAKSPAFSWLREHDLPVPDASLSLESQVEALRALGNGAVKLENLLLYTLNDQQSLDRALEGLAGRLRASGTAGQVDGGPGGELSPRAELHYERRFAEELSSEVVRAALFSNGSDVSVDLRTMSTSWTLPNGQRNTRPLEAFSSGERAFAYTRVQVERLVDDHAENRVIFLDEFGSFVEHDRFEELKRFLRTQALGRAADKIVLILPLRRSPSPDEQLELKQRGGYLASEID